MSHPPLERAGLCPCRKSGGSGGGRGCLEKESPRARHLSRKAGPWAPKPAKAILPRSRPFPLPGGPSVAPGPTQEAGLQVHPASPAASQGHAPPSRCPRREAAVSGREVEKIYTKEHLMLSKFRKRQCPKGLLGPWLGVDQTRGGRGAPALKPRGAARPPGAPGSRGRHSAAARIPCHRGKPSSARGGEGPWEHGVRVSEDAAGTVRWLSHSGEHRASVAGWMARPPLVVVEAFGGRSGARG